LTYEVDFGEVRHSIRLSASEGPSDGHIWKEQKRAGGWLPVSSFLFFLICGGTGGIGFYLSFLRAGRSDIRCQCDECLLQVGEGGYHFFGTGETLFSNGDDFFE